MTETFEVKELYEQVEKEGYLAASQILEAAGVKKGNLFVIGCSTSEVAGAKIGTYSSPDLAKALFQGLYKAACEKEVYLVAQCCEHLNRAIIIEEEAAEKYGLEMVNVKPQLKAGGSFSVAAWNNFAAPCAVEKIQAHAGIDIGDTLIGMHLRAVAVPVRTKRNSIGSAHVVCARTRLKFIGGERAIYQ